MTRLQLDFFEPTRCPTYPTDQAVVSFKEELRRFDQFGRASRICVTEARKFAGDPLPVDTFVNEFWTAKQCAAHSLHEISYRACFKPQLPRFFIERLTRPGETVYDPFMGRGTTLLEAALLGRSAIGCDVNPLSAALIRPRLNPQPISEIAARMEAIDLKQAQEFPEKLLTFYHPETLRAICALKRFLLERMESGAFDAKDDWIRMVAINRLSGHSAGFFSVYTMPPNQAVSIDSQRKINQRRNQSPPFRDVPKLILLKTRDLLADCDWATRERLEQMHSNHLLLTQSAVATPQIPSASLALVVTSPPFLDVVDYAKDNWLRAWFCDIPLESVEITLTHKLSEWQQIMGRVFAELARLLQPGGHIAFEVGEVRKGAVKLEEFVLPCGVEAGLEPVLVLINDQEFTKTSNCWGVKNRARGTNTNRIVLFRKVK